MIKLFIYQIKYYLIAIFLLTIQSCAYVQHLPLSNKINTPIKYNIVSKKINDSFSIKKIPINYEYQPLFEDHRPRNIGDTITIALQENINASNSSDSNISRDGKNNLGITILPGQLNSIIGMNLQENETGLNSIGKNNFSGKGSNSVKNTFNGLITVIVQKILPNGNLRVVGNKKILINEDAEFIRLSGIINPHDISRNNIILSTQIADAKIEYLNNGRVNEAQQMGWFQKFLLKISPI